MLQPNAVLPQAAAAKKPCTARKAEETVPVHLYLMALQLLPIMKPAVTQRASWGLARPARVVGGRELLRHET